MVEFVTYFLPHWKQQEKNERFFFQLFSRCACLLVVWFNENHLEQRLEHELFFVCFGKKLFKFCWIETERKIYEKRQHFLNFAHERDNRCRPFRWLTKRPNRILWSDDHVTPSKTIWSTRGKNKQRKTLTNRRQKPKRKSTQSSGFFDDFSNNFSSLLLKPP